MDNSDRDRFRAFDEIEVKVDQLKEMINMKHSRGASLLTIDSFLTYLFKHHDPLFIEATFGELFPFYLKLLSLFTAQPEDIEEDYYDQ